MAGERPLRRSGPRRTSSELTGDARPRPRRGRRWTTRAVRAALVAIVSVVGLFVIAELSGPRLGAWLLERALPWQHAEVRIGDIDVHGLHGLTATDVRITPDPDGDVLSLDSLETSYSVSELFRAPRRLRRVRLVGLEVEAVRGDSGWSWLEPFSGAGADGTEAEGRSRAIVIDHIEVDAASLVALNEVGRRVLALHLLDADGSIAIGDAPSVRLDGGSLRVERQGLSEARIGARVDREGGVWRVGSLELTDGLGGRIAVTGRVGPRGPDGLALDLHIAGRDFHVAQLHPSLGRAISQVQRVNVAAALRGTTSGPELTAAVGLGETGGLRAEARLVRAGEGRAVGLHIDVDTIDLARLTGRSLEIGPAVGTIDARLTGSAPDSLTGPVRVDLRSLGDDPIRLAGSAEVTSGSAELRLEAAARDLEAQLRGQVVTAGPRPTWDLSLTGTMSAPLPAALATRAPSWRGPWDVTARLAGDGASLDSLVATLDVQLAHVDPTPGARAVTLTGLVADRVLDFQAKGVLSGGTIDGVGAVHLGERWPTWTVDSLNVRDVALAPWVGAWDLGRVHGAVLARANPQGLRAAVRIDSLRGGRLAGLSSSIEIEVGGGRTRVGGSLARDNGRVVIEQIELAGASPKRAAVAFASIDPSRIDGTLPQASLSGHLTLEPLTTESALNRVLLEPVRTASASNGALPVWARSTKVRGRLELSQSTLGGEAVAGGVDWRFVDGELRFGLDLHGGGQSLTLAATSAPFARPLAFSADTVRLENLDLSRWIGSRVPQGRINATLRASVTGTDPSLARAHASLVLDSSRLGPIDVDRGDVTLSLRDGEARLEVRGSRGGRVATIEANVRHQPDRSWRGRGTAFLVDSSVSARDDTLGLRFGFVSPDSSPAGRWRANLEGGGALSGLLLDSLTAALELHERALNVTRLAVAGPTIRLDGEGVLPRGGAGGPRASLVIQGSTTDLGPLLSVAGFDGYRGRATVALRSSGLPTRLRHELQVDVAGLIGRHLEVDSVAVTLLARADSVGRPATWTADVRALGPWFPAGSVPIVIGAGSANGRREDAPASIELTASGNTATPSTLDLSRFVARLDGEAWRLREGTSISWNGGLAIGNLVIRSADGGTIEAKGRLDRRGDQDLSIDLVNLPVAIRGRNSSTALNRHLDLRLNLSGTADSPHLVAEGRAREPDGASPLTVAVDWTADGLELRAEAIQPGGGRFALGGTVPLVLSLAEASSEARGRGLVDVTAEVIDFDLARFRALLDPHDLRDLEGRVNGRLTISGETDAPALDGEVAVNNFGLRFQEYGTVVVSERLVVGFAGNRATVIAAEFRSPRRGTMRITGGVGFPELRLGRFGLELRFDQFQVADSRAVAAVLSGDLALRGRLDAPEVRGRLEIDEATYQVTELNAPSALESIELTEADYRELEERFGLRVGSRNRTGSAAWRAATVDLTVAALSKVWARRAFEPALAVELAGEVHVSKSPGAEPRFAGSIHVVEGRSYVEEFGRRFAVARGTVTLDGPLSSSALDARATYEPTDDVTIILHLRGDADGFSLELDSDPQLDRADIVSYIAVGRPRSDVQRFGEIPEDAAGLGADIAMSRITGELEDVARRSLGLDVVEVRQDGLKGLTLVAGRYPSRRLFLGFQQPVAFQGREGKGFGIDDTEVDAEYRVSQWLLANLSGSRSLARFFLGVRHAY